ncbi:MAG: hypothetical protein RIE73_25020 [Coleofasciculus sp. C1-SOL-03]
MQDTQTQLIQAAKMSALGEIKIVKEYENVCCRQSFSDAKWYPD